MKKLTENYVRRVAIAILNYLRDHPSAKDSAKGIAQWWVGEEHEVVRKALTLLVMQGVIEKRRHIYRLVQNRAVPNDRINIEKALRQLKRRK